MQESTSSYHPPPLHSRSFFLVLVFRSLYKCISTSTPAFSRVTGHLQKRLPDFLSIRGFKIIFHIYNDDLVLVVILMAFVYLSYLQFCIGRLAFVEWRKIAWDVFILFCLVALFFNSSFFPSWAIISFSSSLV